jgi:hypothetical protein
MARRPEMGGCMATRRVVAATHMPAALTHPEVHPPAAGRKALLTPRASRRSSGDAVDMCAHTHTFPTYAGPCKVKSMLPDSMRFRQGVSLVPGDALRCHEPCLVDRGGVDDHPSSKAGATPSSQALSLPTPLPFACHYRGHPRDTPGRSRPRNPERAQLISIRSSSSQTDSAGSIPSSAPDANTVAAEPNSRLPIGARAVSSVHSRPSSAVRTHRREQEAQKKPG